jgi:hypothetical protein
MSPFQRLCFLIRLSLLFDQSPAVLAPWDPAVGRAAEKAGDRGNQKGGKSKIRVPFDFSDAIRIDEAAIKKANAAYWAACCAADRRLENILRSAADAAHARNDGTEEQACLDAAKDVKERADAEGSYATVSAPVAPVTPLRFEQKDSDKKPDSKKTGGGKSDAGKAG